jgi:VanZ like family/Concanavalin A-like lectin/glucanases superfamily
MNNVADKKIYVRVLGVLCVCILCVIFCAGLWPFRAPRNNVRWLNKENGLQFGHHGIVASIKPFRVGSHYDGCSLEIWLEPERMDASGTILSFDNYKDPKFAFALRQFGHSLAIQRATIDGRGRMFRGWLSTDGAFQKSDRVLLTITGSQKQTVVYVNGVRAKTSSGFGLVNGDLTGQLILGNSTIKDSWPGQIMGMAVYDFELTPSQIETHFERWTQQQVSLVHGQKAPVAVYLFDEHEGNVVHDRTGSAHDLVIPARYFVLRPTFLEPAWDQFRGRWEGWMSWSYWSDVCLNVAGFIPLGFFFTAYFSLVQPIPWPRAVVVVLGLTISLAIETLQYFLPTRDSSMADVITNTLGTVVGVALYRRLLIRKLLTRPFVVAVNLWLRNSLLLGSRVAQAGKSYRV